MFRAFEVLRLLTVRSVLIRVTPFEQFPIKEKHDDNGDNSDSETRIVQMNSLQSVL